ncbi:MAG: C_GCAxxG_C_C family protein [Desulfobacterales bacterium]|nr:C_GCAxxG_C_C family protein [Desulfobacterales bacterium]MBF0398316.1 C_GCAxxG_C_C family protein [Desulfobacterales bacterium]
MNNAIKAVDLFKNGYACSQAILSTYGRDFGLNQDLAVKISAGFAGGMRMGELCGAVTASFMVLGLAFCTNECTKPIGRSNIYTSVKIFTDKFRVRNGSVVCRELLGCDISTSEGMKIAQEKNLFKTTCVEMVQDASEILDEMLQKS